MKSSKLGAFLCILMMPGLAAALSTDRDQPIYIESDTADIDDSKDTSIYRGEVRLTQGTIHLSADELTIYGLRDPEKIVAVGEPVRFRQRPDNKDEDVHGEALRVEYITADDKVYLFEKAKLSFEDNTFASHRIEYDVNKSLVQAGESAPEGERASGSERVKVRIQPKKRSQETTPAQ